MGWNNVPPNGFPQIPDIEDLEDVVNDVAGLKTIKANKADIAPEFSATSNYAVGDLVYYEGTLYKCTTAHEAAAWNAEHFTETTLEAEIAELQGDVSDLGTTKANQITIATTFSSETAYDPGDLVYYNGLTYRCTNSHEGAWDAADFAATTIAGELSELNSKFTNYSKRVKSSFGNGDTDIDISSLGLGTGMITCATWEHYAVYAFYREASSLFVHKVNSDGATITVTAKDASTITVTSTAAAGGTYTVTN